MILVVDSISDYQIGEYKEALARATARERAERIISRIVISGANVTEEQADRIYERELKRVSRKFTHMRYHSFLMLSTGS